MASTRVDGRSFGPGSRYARPIAHSRTLLGQTPEERRARRREALIDAALTIVHEDGPLAVTMRRACTLANLNQRYFYESFTNADELLIAALDKVIGEMLGVGFAALHETRDEASLITRARHGLEIGLSVLLADPRKATLLASVPAGPEPLRNAFRDRVGQLTDIILSDPEAAELGVRPTTAIFVTAGTSQVVAAYLTGDLELDHATLLDELARLAIGSALYREQPSDL